MDSLYAANYKLTVIDTFGCFLNNNFDLSEPEPYQTYASTTFPLICESDSGYLMIDSIVGGGNINFGFNYNISTGPLQTLYMYHLGGIIYILRILILVALIQFQ